MNAGEFDDFFLAGGDELMNSQPYPKRKEPKFLFILLARTATLNLFKNVKILADGEALNLNA